MSAARKARGRRIRARRMEMRLDVRELARRAGTVPATIRNWEAGRTDMTIERLLALSAALGMPYGEIIEP
jgi:transcriptional regulator with XRE-family HTH domain